MHRLINPDILYEHGASMVFSSFFSILLWVCFKDSIDDAASSVPSKSSKPSTLPSVVPSRSSEPLSIPSESSELSKLPSSMPTKSSEPSSMPSSVPSNVSVPSSMPCFMSSEPSSSYKIQASHRLFHSNLATRRPCLLRCHPS